MSTEFLRQDLSHNRNLWKIVVGDQVSFDPRVTVAWDTELQDWLLCCLLKKNRSVVQRLLSRSSTMPMSETLRKQNLYAEIIILVRNLNEAGGSGGPSLSYPSQEEVSAMTVQELEAMKRELRDLARSLGGTSNR